MAQHEKDNSAILKTQAQQVARQIMAERVERRLAVSIGRLARQVGIEQQAPSASSERVFANFLNERGTRSEGRLVTAFVIRGTRANAAPNGEQMLLLYSLPNRGLPRLHVAAFKFDERVEADFRRVRVMAASDFVGLSYESPSTIKDFLAPLDLSPFLRRTRPSNLQDSTDNGYGRRQPKRRGWHL